MGQRRMLYIRKFYVVKNIYIYISIYIHRWDTGNQLQWRVTTYARGGGAWGGREAPPPTRCWGGAATPTPSQCINLYDDGYGCDFYVFSALHFIMTRTVANRHDCVRSLIIKSFIVVAGLQWNDCCEIITTCKKSNYIGLTQIQFNQKIIYVKSNITRKNTRIIFYFNTCAAYNRVCWSLI